LQTAAAHYDAARALRESVSSAKLPSVGLDASAARTRTSANRPLTTYGSIDQSAVQSNPQIAATASYEVDLFGRIHLFSAPSLIWSIGASVSQPLFERGRLAAGVDYAKANYAAAQATYRQMVLNAFEEGQNAVTRLSVLQAALQRASAASADARKLVDLAQHRYAGGLTPYLDVISAQQQSLTSERQEVPSRGQRAALVVYLAKALGGGWHESGTAVPSTFAADSRPTVSN